MDYIIFCLDQELDTDEKNELEKYMKGIENNSKYIEKRFKEYLILKKMEKSNPDIKVDTLKEIIDKMDLKTTDDSFDDLKIQYEETFEQLCKKSGTNLSSKLSKGKIRDECIIAPKVILFSCLISNILLFILYVQVALTSKEKKEMKEFTDGIDSNAESRYRVYLALKNVEGIDETELKYFKSCIKTSCGDYKKQYKGLCEKKKELDKKASEPSESLKKHITSRREAISGSTDESGPESDSDWGSD